MAVAASHDYHGSDCPVCQERFHGAEFGDAVEKRNAHIVHAHLDYAQSHMTGEFQNIIDSGGYVISPRVG